MTWPNTVLIRVQTVYTLYVITDKSNSGNLTRAGRSDDESARGHDVYETFEPKHSSGNSYGSSDGGNNEDTNKHNVSSGRGESNNTQDIIINYCQLA